MINFEIEYPSLNHRNYIEAIYNFCKENRFSMILKGSLANGTATKFSDIDLVILGNIDSFKVDEIISLYGKPVMANFTENPKGILILVYQNNISVDLDIRETISQQDLVDSLVLLKYDRNFIINEKEIIRQQIKSEYIPNRAEWYKVLRLFHKGISKYLSNKTNTAYNFLEEIKEKLSNIQIADSDLNNNFEDDVRYAFDIFCKEFEVDPQIKMLFDNLFKEF